MSEPGADYRQFFCMSCGVKLRAKASKAGKQLPCPSCATVLVVPGSSENDSDMPHNINEDTYAIRAPEEELRPMIAPQEHSGPLLPVSPNATVVDNTATQSYAISDMSPDNAEEPQDGEKKHRGLIQEPSVRPTPPRWPLVQGVLGFLLDPGTIVFWAMLSFWGTMCASLLTAAVALGASPSIPSWMGSVFAHGISGSASMIWIIVNSGCCLAILQESAAGNRVVEDWPGFALIDLFLESFYIINSVVLSIAAAWFLTAPLAALGVLRAFCEVGIFVAVFPIVLLSMLEAGSCFLPVSSAMYAGLRRSLRTWLVFFAESLVMAFGLLLYVELLAFLLRFYSEHVTIPIIFLTVAVAVAPAVLLEMIYFRLLGRLAWVCDEDARKQLAEEEEDEEDEDEEDEIENAETSEIRHAPVDDF